MLLKVKTLKKDEIISNLSYNTRMLDRETLLTQSAKLRFSVDDRIDLKDPLGLYLGFVRREKQIFQTAAIEEGWDYGENQFKDKLLHNEALSHILPNPFWMGIHPTIYQKMHEFADQPESSFWDTKIGRQPSRAKTRLVPVESQIDTTEANEQIEFINRFLPEGSLNTVFFTKGNRSIWNKVPVAGAFAGNPHQMSIPLAAGQGVTGFNMLLLTETPSVTVPMQWKENETYTLMQQMNLHQVAHCKTVPTCWEYIDRTYSLLSPSQLLDLTVARNNSLANWFRHYGFDLKPGQSFDDETADPYVPDSTSYLYEIKVIERAIMINKSQKNIKRLNELPKDLYWFRGFHIDEICEQIGGDRSSIYGAINEMNEYWLEGTNRKPFDAVYNSAVFSTDIGTQPCEEVCIDVLAMEAAGQLPEKYNYWKPWLSKVNDTWKNWQPQK